MRCVVKPFPTALTDAEPDELHGLPPKGRLIKPPGGKISSYKIKKGTLAGALRLNG